MSEMEDSTIIKITENMLIDDLKKRVLTSKERAELISKYKEITGKDIDTIAAEIGLSPGRVSQYLTFKKNGEGCETISEYLKNSKFSVYDWITDGHRYLVRLKDVRLRPGDKEKLLIVRERINILLSIKI